MVQQTLPPSWTATFTSTPSRTPSPSPVPPTLTATPVPGIAEICASFVVDYAFEDGHRFFPDDTITILFGTQQTLARDPATNTVEPVQARFLATHLESGENLGVQSDGGQLAVMELAASRLPQNGDYTWKAYLYGARMGEQCTHEGSFSLYDAAQDLPAAAEATAQATAES